MSISKRTRFEILRRCNFACFYCGLPAPVAILEIDHVMPRARGGTDAPWNLVAACDACNAGKLDGVPLDGLIERSRAEWAAYTEGRGHRWIFCDGCGLPLAPEDEWHETGYARDCGRCLDVWERGRQVVKVADRAYGEMLSSIVDGMFADPFGAPAWHSDMHPRPYPGGAL